MADSTITPGEVRIELQLEGVKSVLSAGFLTIGASNVRIEALLTRIAEGVEALRSPREARETNHGMTPIALPIAGPAAKR